MPTPVLKKHFVLNMYTTVKFKQTESKRGQEFSRHRLLIYDPAKYKLTVHLTGVTLRFTPSGDFGVTYISS